ncbi:MAG: TonB-dependent receptor [Halioglobus sp.]
MNKNYLVKTVLAASVATVCSGTTTLVVAQTESLRLEEVIVTARKREESMQDIPVSVTSLSEQLKRSTLKDMRDVQNYVPNVNIDKIGSNNGVSISIRGISFQDTDKSIDPPAGVILDGVYMGVIAGGVLNNFDMERIEVLRGPQGTLFGKNTTAGALNVIRSAPTKEWGVKAKIGAGSWDMKEVQAIVNMPLTDKGGLKFYANKNEHDGFVENNYIGDDIGIVDYQQFGATVAFNFTDNFDISFTAERVEDDSDVGAYANFNDSSNYACLLSLGAIPGDASGAPIGSGCQEFDTESGEDNSSVNEPNTSETTNDYYNLTMNWAIGDWALTSVTGYVDREEDFRGEYDASQLELLYIEASQEYEQFSQELRINGNINDNINLTAGLYYWNSEYDQFQESYDMWYYIVPALGAEGGLWPGAASQQLDGTGENTSYAAFASVDWQLTDRLLLNLGGRVTQEERKLTTAVPGFMLNPMRIEIAAPGPDLDFKEDWTEFSPRVALSYDIRDDFMVFGSFSSGFKSGGFYARTQDVDDINSYDPEYVDTYEIGMKSEWFDNRLRFNATAFYSEYTDKQEEVIVNQGNGNITTIVLNAADAEIAGVELEFTAQITGGLSAFFNLGIIDAEFTEFIVSDLEGNIVDNSDLELRNAPETNIGLGLDYFLPLSFGELGAHYTYRWRDEYHTILNNNPKGLVESAGFHNASLDLMFGEHYRVSVYGRNIGNERYARVVDIGLSSWGNYNSPEQYGVELSLAF